MFITSPESTQESRLRVAAEMRLREGSAPPTRGWPTGLSALNLLHTLASDPGSAHEALKVLHELQVHQVELDLLHEQTETNQRELIEDLAHYQALFELAPMAYCTLGLEGDILDANAAAAHLFGIASDELRGRQFKQLLTPESRSALKDVLNRLRTGTSPDTCDVQLSSANGSRPLRIVISAGPGSKFLLAMLLDTTSPRQPHPRA